MGLQSTLEELLPTWPAKVAGLATAALSSVPFLLPEFLWSEMQLMPQTLLWLLKLSMAGVLLLTGVCVTLLFVIHHYTRGKGQNEIAERILKVQAEKNRQALTQKTFFNRLGK